MNPATPVKPIDDTIIQAYQIVKALGGKLELEYRSNGRVQTIKCYTVGDIIRIDINPGV